MCTPSPAPAPSASERNGCRQDTHPAPPLEERQLATAHLHPRRATSYDVVARERPASRRPWTVYMCVRVCLRPDIAACLCLGIHVCSKCRVRCGGMMHVSLLTELRVSLPVPSRITGTLRACQKGPPPENTFIICDAHRLGLRSCPRDEARAPGLVLGWVPPREGDGRRFFLNHCVLADLLRFIVALRLAHVPCVCLAVADSLGVPPTPALPTS